MTASTSRQSPESANAVLPSFTRYPTPIINAIEKIPSLVESDAFCRRPKFERRRYAQSREACKRLLICLVKHTCLAQNGLIVKMLPYERGDPGRNAMPLTVMDMAKLTGMTLRRTERAKRELQAMGWLEADSQVVRYKGGNVLEVNPVARKLTVKFWTEVDSLEEFRTAVLYAVQRVTVYVSAKLVKWARNAKNAVNEAARKAVKTGKTVFAGTARAIQNTLVGGGDKVAEAVQSCPFNPGRTGQQCSNCRNKAQICGLCKYLGVNLGKIKPYPRK